MSETEIQIVPGGGPSLVQSTKSRQPGMRGSWFSLCLRHRGWRRGCMGWWLWCQVQVSGRSSRQHSHVGVSPVAWYVCAVADIIGKPESLTMVKECVPYGQISTPY